MGEVKRQTINIAVALVNRGIAKSDIIAFSGQNSIQHVVLRFVAYFTGNTFMPLSPTFGKYEVEEEYNNVGANIIFTSETDLYKFDNIVKGRTKLVVIFNGNTDKFTTFEQLLEEGSDQTLDRIPYFDVNPETDPFMLIHTSGSTGNSKCAIILHRTMLHFINERGAPALDTNERTGYTTAIMSPMGHVAGNFFLLLGLTKRGHNCIVQRY